MKYFKTLGIYKASNVTFNPTTCDAMSYDWWKFVKSINGCIVFNSFYYSPTTLKHQHKVRRLLADLGIEIDLEVKTRLSLESPEALSDAANICDQKANELIEKTKQPRTRASTNGKRLEEARQEQSKAYAIRQFMRKKVA